MRTSDTEHTVKIPSNNPSHVTGKFLLVKLMLTLSKCSISIALLVNKIRYLSKVKSLNLCGIDPLALTRSSQSTVKLAFFSFASNMIWTSTWYVQYNQTFLACLLTELLYLFPKRRFDTLTAKTARTIFPWMSSAKIVQNCLVLLLLPLLFFIPLNVKWFCQLLWCWKFLEFFEVFEMFFKNYLPWIL